MTVIFQQNIRVHAVVQSLIIEHIHPSMYWSKNMEQANIHWIICLGIYLKAHSLWIIHSNLLHVTLHKIYLIFIYYYTAIWLVSLEDWRRKQTHTAIYWKIGLNMTLFQNNATNLKKDVFYWSHVNGTGMLPSLIFIPAF